jgi:Fic family protein
MASFFHHDLRLINPGFSSPLVDVLTELEHLRRLKIFGTTPPLVFMQLKSIFHTLESLASSRIEGNHTTLADYLESRMDVGQQPIEDRLLEVANIESAMREVDNHVQPKSTISEHFIRHLHAVTVAQLVREGDDTPGAYRHKNVLIAQAAHRPPDAVLVPGYMRELVDFINNDDAQKYDLIKMALAHHRFAWIHPFSNGNGRVVRLLTYALLIKYGFRANTAGGILNPAAVFCADRERYYAMLGQTDSGIDADLESWCFYVLAGVRDELIKVDRLTDYTYVCDKVLHPAIHFAQQRQWVTPSEALVLSTTLKFGVVKAGDLAEVMSGKNAAQRTYQIKKLVSDGMLLPIKPGARQYTIGFDQNILLRGVIRALTDEGFISAALAG